MLGGWTVSGISFLQSGTPFTAFTGAAFAGQLINPALPATATNIQFAPGSGNFNANGDNNDYPSLSGYTQTHNNSAFHSGRGVLAVCPGGVLPCGNFTLPALGTEGNETPNQFRNPGYADVDFTLKKITTITERSKLELRLDTFNVFNRVNYLTVDLNNSNNNPQNGAFGQSTGTNPARNMLLGGELSF